MKSSENYFTRWRTKKVKRETTSAFQRLGTGAVVFIVV